MGSSRGRMGGVMKSTEWMSDAKCADPQYNADMWFPTSTGNGQRIEAERAAAVCRTCKVIFQCNERAKTEARGQGVWAAKLRGGKHPPEIIHGTAAGYRAHIRRDDPACLPCRNAHSLADRLRDKR